MYFLDLMSSRRRKHLTHSNGGDDSGGSGDKSDDEGKSPHELVDEEERANNPVRETEELMEKDRKREKKEKERLKKEQEEKEKAEKSRIEKRKEELRNQIDILTYESRLADLEEHLEMEKKRSRMRLEDELEDLEQNRKRMKIHHESSLLSSKLHLVAKQNEWNDHVENQPDRRKNPVISTNRRGEVEVVVSDRMIELTGVITYETSEYVTDRIHYYNNKCSTSPIFIIIDYSPGGSVMAGYRILKSMESSQAPIYVVVKSYAASMAAAITTMAQHSMVFPNAIVLHHQIWTRGCGNLKQQEEQLSELKEWWKRLAGPICKKLGISLTEWQKRMYENNSDGDWKVFGDQAVKLGWVDQVVDKIRHTGLVDNPDKARCNGYRWGPHHFCFQCRMNGGGEEAERKHTVQHEKILPPLRPLDYYWVYNKDGYYELAK